MIAYLRGICQAVEDDAVVVDVRGVGYLVSVSERDRSQHQVGGDAELLVHTEVREDAIALYGFVTAADRDMFRALIGVPGVGPKAAMALISALEPGPLAAAIQGEKLSELTKAKGIGKRTAETIVVKLRDRLPASASLQPTTGAAKAPLGSPLLADLLSALINLGYRPQAAETAAAQALADPANSHFDTALRASLALLRRPGS